MPPAQEAATMGDQEPDLIDAEHFRLPKPALDAFADRCLGQASHVFGDRTILGGLRAAVEHLHHCEIYDPIASMLDAEREAVSGGYANPYSAAGLDTAEASYWQARTARESRDTTERAAARVWDELLLVVKSAGSSAIRKEGKELLQNLKGDLNLLKAAAAAETGTIRIPVRCDRCGGERAYQTVDIGVLQVETGYWGDRPEEYEHYPGDGPFRSEPRRTVIGAECPDCVDTVVRLSTAISEYLLDLLQRDPDRLHHLSPQMFEQLIADLLGKMGFMVTLVGRVNTPDGGIDLIAVPKYASVGAPLIAGQIKHHRTGRKTGLEAVDRLLAWRDSQFQIGLLVTNTDFTRTAEWKSNQPQARNFIRLRNKVDITRWLAGK